MEAAKGNEEPPPELEIMWGCQRYGCLPEQGGYLDQDARLMALMATFDNVYTFVKSRQSKEKRDYAELSPAERALFDMLVDLGVKF